MRPAFRLTPWMLVLFAPVALAGPIGGTGNHGSYSGSLDYNSATSQLTITLNNLSGASNGGYLTGFAFNVYENSALGIDITGVNITTSSDADFGLLGGGTTYQNGVDGNPHGQFDIGLSTGGNFEGGGSPSLGIGVGEEAMFVLTLSGTNLSLLTTADFYVASEGTGAGQGYEQFLARFRGFGSGDSDKVPGGPPPIVVNQNPEPASLVLASIGAGCMFFHARRVRKQQRA